MKKLFFIAAFILMAGIVCGQTLQKGNLVSMSVYTVTLDMDATMNQYIEVWTNKIAPAVEANMEADYYIIKGIKGECENCYGDLWVFESKEAWNKYFNDDDTPTEMGQAAWEKIQPALDELAKLGTYTREFTDWIVQ